MRKESRDIFAISSGVIVHPMSCGGELVGGFTNQIIKKFPKVLNHFKDSLSEESRMYTLGRVSFFEVSNQVSIANLYCRLTSNNQSIFEFFAFKNCLEHLKQKFPNLNYYFPYKLGCGLQGGNWKEIEKLIRQTIPKSTICILPNVCPSNPKTKA